jgi:threonine synthase
MQYFSTKRNSPHVTFREATLKGQPSDKGLYFPAEIPKLLFESLIQKSQSEIAFDVIKPYVGNDIPQDILLKICEETVNFDFPLVKISDNISTLELFHGETLAFKDVGARFMSRCLQYFSAEKDEKTIVLVATSGDTGGAVAAGFHNVENVEVVILYPKGKVSNVQELQLTTLGGNITAVEVSGTFDDCQALAKQALADEMIQEKVFLTSANSINIARWLPQQFYYFYALKQWREQHKSTKKNPVVCVPSGNFGNICAGILAHISGLPVEKFIAATNANDIIPRFMENGEMNLQPPIATLSNAMDVGNPSNFVRILEMCDQKYLSLKEKMISVSVSDEITLTTMKEVFENYKYVLDPHGAVGFYALNSYLDEHKIEKGFFLETAHPIKFDSVKTTIGTFGETPESVKKLFDREKKSIEMNVNYEDLKDLLLAKII